MSSKPLDASVVGRGRTGMGLDRSGGGRQGVPGNEEKADGKGAR